ncbi:MAG: DegV family EDD domain-containing protein [Lachnospiraceae bacterium]|nr:DegV family EDD domain-containing protein [Lachnospiraceae bacterium]
MMNLKVEKRLLAETKVKVDTASSGIEALKRTLEEKYDAILMDHLMPGMDGIECLGLIRTQTGGMNTNTPVIVLTANVGAKNQDIYTASGFDGYLNKPVSGQQLEEMLLKNLPKEKVSISESVQMNAEGLSTAKGYRRKIPVIFAAGSLSDVPEVLRRREDIAILQWTLATEEGIFRDNVEMSADELIRYMESGKSVKSGPPEVQEYIDFFSDLLKKAHHVIYVALTTSLSVDYKTALEAAKSFENVLVINSQAVSSSLAILMMAGCRMAQQNTPPDRIVNELEEMKKRLHSGFLLGTTEFMARRGLISQRVQRIAASLDLKPALRYKGDNYSVAGVWKGSGRHVYDRYIRSSLPRKVKPDTELLFVTYTAINEEDLLWIEEQIRKRADFKHIIFQKASAAITSNCGPGTFGLLYVEKGSGTYNLSGILPKEIDVVQTGAAETDKQKRDDQPEKTEGSDKPWFEKLEGINASVGIKHCGSEDMFRSMLAMFYDSIKEKADEIEAYYGNEDWENYTIKVHALKSSARIIGAMSLGDEALRLEEAGKDRDVEYIHANNARVMADLRHYSSVLEKVKKYF